MANNVSDEMYEHLREILEKQNGKTYTFEEAKEIGDELIDFFALLIQLDTDDNNIDKEAGGLTAC